MAEETAEEYMARIKASPAYQSGIAKAAASEVGEPSEHPMAHKWWPDPDPEVLAHLTPQPPDKPTPPLDTQS